MTYERAREVLREDVQTLDDLRAALGSFSATEQELLAAPGLHDDPTTEELALLGDDFVVDVAAIAAKALSRHTIVPARSFVLFQGGLRLLTMLKEIEAEDTHSRLAQRVGPGDQGLGCDETRDLAEKKRRLATSLADLWQELRAGAD